MTENMELLRMIMENNAGQSPAFILEQYAVYKAGLAEINSKYGAPLTPEALEALASAPSAASAVKQPKSSLTAGYSKRSLKFNPAEAIQQDKIICCICGSEGKTLTGRHLATHNGLTREGYIKLCGYPPNQNLMSLNHLEAMQKNVKKAQKARKDKLAGPAGKAKDGKI